jgi:hypothetical protein
LGNFVGNNCLTKQINFLKENIMKKLKLMKVNGKIYNVIGLYGGNIYLGNPYDVNNDVVKNGVIWEMQPFYNDVSKVIKLYFTITRFFSTDVFGKSEFKNKLSKVKFF